MMKNRKKKRSKNLKVPENVKQYDRRKVELLIGLSIMAQ